jgi:hypothetical protein
VGVFSSFLLFLLSILVVLYKYVWDMNMDFVDPVNQKEKGCKGYNLIGRPVYLFVIEHHYRLQHRLHGSSIRVRLVIHR